MKNTFLLFAWLILPIIGFGQSESSEVTLKGHINFDDQYQVVISFPEEKDAQRPSLMQSVESSGDFEVNFDLPEAEFIRFTIIPTSRKRQLAINFPLYLEPGQTSNLDLHYTDSTYLSLVKSDLGNGNDALIKFSNFHFTRQKELFYVHPDKDSVQSFLNGYLNYADELARSLQENEVHQKNYLHAWAVNDYIQTSRSLTARYAQSGAGMNVSSRELLSQLPLEYYETPEAILLPETYSSLNAYLNTIYPMDAITSPLDAAAKQLKVFNATFKNQTLKDFYNYNTLQTAIRYVKFASDDDFQKQYQQFEDLAKAVDNQEGRNVLIRDFNRVRFTTTGAPMPDVAFKDADGKEVSLKSFEGKYVYIDLWASWCIPCIQEVPALKKLKSDYADKNIAILSVSLDEDKQAWRDKMKDLDLTGYQYETGDSEFEKMMNVMGIPHFILYDDAGKLMIYKAPRPSSVSIRNIFDSL